jgi:hypothetical protein
MNSAQRIKKIYSDFQNVTPPALTGHQTYAYDAWANLFNRHAQVGQEIEQIGEECAYAVRQELQVLANLLRERGVPSELYESHISSLRQITSARHLHDAWQNISKSVKPEHFVLLDWAGFYLGGSNHDSTEIDAEIERLAAEVDKLIQEVEDGDLPQVLRAFLLRSFRSIKDGIWRFKVTGLDPLRSSIQTVRGTSDQQIDELRQAVDDLPEEKRNLWNRAAGVINSVAEACDKATKIDGGYTLLSNADKLIGLAFGG